MEAKEFLEQLKKINRMIENKRVERDQWYAMATSTTAASAPDTGVRVQSTGNPQRIAAAVDNYIDIEREIAESTNKLYAERQKIISVIEQLKGPEYDVIHKRYVGILRNGKAYYLSFDEIADAHGNSKSWATATHGEALKNVQKIIDNRMDL